jgi:toxin ParE1/3/4
MSAPKFQIELARRAKIDFRDLLSFTGQTWGEKQRVTYRDRIIRALQMIAQNPKLGRKRNGLMAYQAGQHRIFYRVEGAKIYVLRILHDRMDAMRHLPEN